MGNSFVMLRIELILWQICRDKRIIIWCEVYFILFIFVCVSVCYLALTTCDSYFHLFIFLTDFDFSYAMLCLQFRKCLFYTIQDRMSVFFWFLCFICSYLSPQFSWIHELSIIHEIVGLKILFYDIKKNKSIIEHK